MKRSIIAPEQQLTFSDYFKLRASTEDILDYFGYARQKRVLDLPHSLREMPSYECLRARLEDHLINISFENELTRREFLIAPIMSEVRILTNAKLLSEYWFEFNHQLKGSLDYFVRNIANLLVVEAENADLTRGFTQLAVEMIALDKADETDENLIYGAVSTGQEWQFGILTRRDKTVFQDVNVYVLPANLEKNFADFDWDFGELIL